MRPVVSKLIIIKKTLDNLLSTGLNKGLFTNSRV
jgi:hypothetical protein